MNNSLLITLPQRPSSQASYATLARFDGKAAWQYLVMPTEMQWTRNANYQAANSASNIPIIQYASTESWQVSMNLNLLTQNEGRLLTQYVAQLAALQEPEEKGAPPILVWRWGSRVLSPCVLTQCARTENAWSNNGELMGCRLSLALLQVSEKQLIV